MHRETTMAAIEAALQSIECCPCGKGLDITARDGGLWLECRTYVQPSRLPGWLALALRDVMHERRFVIDEPGAVGAADATAPRPFGASGPAARGA